MKIGPVTICEYFRSASGDKTRDWLLVAYHPRGSYTWRFVAWWRGVPRIPVKRGLKVERRNTGIHAHCDLWVFGRIGFDTQRRLGYVREDFCAPDATEDET